MSMKQTNNAIKFLVAQYRAIFKNAYLKNIGVALAVAAGVSVSSASAAAGSLDSNANLKDNADSVAGTVLNISGAETFQHANHKFVETINLSSGSSITSVANGSNVGAIFFKNLTANGATITLQSTSSNTVGGMHGTYDTTDQNWTYGSTATITNSTVNVKGHVGFQANDMTITNSTVNLDGDYDSGNVGAGISAVKGNLVISKSNLTLSNNSYAVGLHHTLSSDSTVTLKGSADAGQKDYTAGLVASIGGSLNVNGTVNVVANSGGRIRSDNTTIGSTAKINNSGTLYLGREQTGVLRVDAGAKIVNATGATLNLLSNSMTFADGTLNNQGTLNINVHKGTTTNLSIGLGDFTANFVGTKVAVSGDGSDTEGLTLNVTGAGALNLGSIVSGDGSFLTNKFEVTNVENVNIVAKDADVTLAANIMGDKFTSLTANKLTAGTEAAGFTVGTGKTVTVNNGLTVTGTGLNVSGTLSLNGGNSSAKALTVTAGSATLDNGAAFTLGTGALKVDNSAKLNIFGGSSFDASKAESVSLSGSTVALADGSNLTISSDKLYGIADTTLTSSASIVKDAVAGDVSSTITVSSGTTAVSLTKAQFEALLANYKDTFKGSFSGLDITDLTVENNMNINDVVSNVGDKYTGIQANTADGNVSGTKVVGSVQVTKEGATNVSVANDGALSLVDTSTSKGGNFVENAKGETLGVALGSGSVAALAGDGKVKDITASADSAKVVVGTAANKGTVQVLGDVGSTTNAIADVTVNAGNSLEVGNNVYAKNLSLDGSLNAKNVTATTELFVAADSNVAETLTIGSGASATAGIDNGATLTAKVIEVKGGTGTTIIVGNDEATEGEVGTGYLSAERVNLASGTLLADPAFGQAASIVAVSKFGGGTAADDVIVTNGASAGKLDGTVGALRNAVVAIGATKDQALADLADFFDAKGSLSDAAGAPGSIVYVKSGLSVDGGKIIADKAMNSTDYANQAATKYANSDLYLGAGSYLVVSTEAATSSTSNNAASSAIKFNKNDAKIVVGDSASSKVVLVGSGVGVNKTVSLFSDNSGGVSIDKDLTVETSNGLFSTTLTSGADVNTSAVKLELQAAKLDKSFTEVSAPVRETLRQYATGYREFTIENGVLANQKGQLHGALTDKTKTQYEAMQAAEQSKYVLIGEKVYLAASNPLLDQAVTSTGAAADIDTVTRAGAFTGVAHATVAAGSTTAGAIGARFGLGSTPVNVTTASNNVGGALFVAPVYASMDSDGFSAQGTNYGVDVDLYGAAIGADFEVAPDFRIGGVLNFGKGDTEGNGAAAGAKDEFDYFGIGLFAGWSAGPLAIVGDINYTRVSNDLELNLNSLGKYTTSLDSTNLNLGVGAQYAMDFDGLAVVPHAGIRYTRVEADDYSVAGVGAYTGDEVSVVTIPVGVTLAKAFNANDWVIKPLFDLTLAANMGDDSLTGSFKWEGVEDFKTGVESEILDNFSYAATVGIAGQTGNFAGSIGVNYTGSSNTDSFAVSAAARYLF